MLIFSGVDMVKEVEDEDEGKREKGTSRNVHRFITFKGSAEATSISHGGPPRPSLAGSLNH